MEFHDTWLTPEIQARIDEIESRLIAEFRQRVGLP